MAAAIRIRHPDAALFASDMHLDSSRPELTARFLTDLDRCLRQTPGSGERPSLFLLGDLFEYWIGDDDVPEPALAVAERLAALAAAGGSVYLMRGNRDFLMDVPLPADSNSAEGTDGAVGRVPRFSSRCGAVMLTEPTVIEVEDRRIVLCHGDALCTDDTRYQQWRALCRSPAWQQALLAKPVGDRRAMAVALRQQSQAAQRAAASVAASASASSSDAASPSANTETVGDVSQRAVDELMAQTGAALMIHGHTHRPAVHPWSMDGQVRHRWVLSDWETGPPQARGSVKSLAEGCWPRA